MKKKFLTIGLLASIFLVSVECRADAAVNDDSDGIRLCFEELDDAKPKGPNSSFFFLCAKCKKHFLLSCEKLLSKKNFEIVSRKHKEDEERLKEMKARFERVMKKPSHQDLLVRLGKAFIENPKLTYLTLANKNFSVSGFFRELFLWGPSKAESGAGIHTLLRPEETEKALDEMLQKSLEAAEFNEKEIEDVKFFNRLVHYSRLSSKIASLDFEEDEREKIRNILNYHQRLKEFLGTRRIGRWIKISKVFKKGKREINAAYSFMVPDRLVAKRGKMLLISEEDLTKQEASSIRQK